jgi:hypothetical protein
MVAKSALVIENRVRYRSFASNIRHSIRHIYALRRSDDESHVEIFCVLLSSAHSVDGTNNRPCPL